MNFLDWKSEETEEELVHSKKIVLLQEVNQK